MGYNIPPGFSRVTFEYGSESPLGSQIVTGVGIDQGPTEAILDIFQEWWEESLRLVSGAGYTLQRLEARNNVEVLDRSIGSSGLLSQEMLPPNCAALINVGSGLVGRQHRGRIFLPGVLQEEEVNGQGTLSTESRDQLQGVVDTLGAMVTTAGRTLRILHSGPGTPTLALSATVSSTIATQRRRLRR